MNLSFLSHVEYTRAISLLLFHLCINILEEKSETLLLFIDLDDPILSVDNELVIRCLQIHWISLNSLTML